MRYARFVTEQSAHKHTYTHTHRHTLTLPREERERYKTTNEPNEVKQSTRQGTAHGQNNQQNTK